MILIIDNYDSFTYNLVQLIGMHTNDYSVVRNNCITIDEVRKMKVEKILLSPGPGRPEDAGICVDLIREFGEHTPLLGVCLGHQAIGYAFGAAIIHAPSLMHGKTSQIHHAGEGLFHAVGNPFTATRYHSLVISPENIPDELEVTATSDDGVIMGVRHRTHPVEGIQFHPESILTTEGPRIIANWIGRSSPGVA